MVSPQQPAGNSRPLPPAAEPLTAHQKTAAEILAKLNLPENLRGRTVNLIAFKSEEDCRSCYPDRSLSDHEKACAYVRAEVRRRGGETRRVHLGKHHQNGSQKADERTRRADDHNQLISAFGAY